MEDNEEKVVEATENVGEQATEEVVEGNKDTAETEQVEEKLYTESDLERKVNERLDEIMPRKLKRLETKLSKKYEDQLHDAARLQSVINAGLGTNNYKESAEKLEDFYGSKGIKIPEYPQLTERQKEILARSEAEDIIASGYEDIVEETNRLANKGYDNLTETEKIVFEKLSKERETREAIQELSKLGIGEKDLEDAKFKDYATKLNPSLSLKEKYEMYIKANPKPEVKPIGSMKSAIPEKTVKEFYTPEEVSRLSDKDLDDPEIMKRVEASMTKWYKEEK